MKNMQRLTDADVRSTELMSYMHSELRERDSREVVTGRARLQRNGSNSHASTSVRRGDVQLLIPANRGKKTVKWNIIESGRTARFSI